MRRVQSSAAVFGLSALVLVVLALSVPASGGAGAPGRPDVSTLSEAATAPASVESTEFPALPAAGLKGETCQADPGGEVLTEAAAPHRFRTCRCSCGAPCQTDADCGGGVGSCRPGITCC